MDSTQHDSLARPPTSSSATAHADWDPPSVSGASLPSGGRPRRRGRVAVWFARGVMALCLSGLLVIVGAAVVPSDWFVEAPNGRLGVDQPAPFAQVPAAASSVEEIVEFDDLGEDVQMYDDDGAFYYVTIRLPSQTALSWWVSEDDPTVRFITWEDKYGFQSPSQRAVQSQQMMATSEQIAQFVALQRLGFDVELTLGNVIVQELLCQEPGDEAGTCAVWPPSDDLIDPGDTIVSADGQDIENLEDLSGVLERHAPGDEIEISVDRNGQDVSGSVELIESPEEPGRPLIGFLAGANPQVELPFELDFDTRSTGGPSAGLAFALELTDELSEGQLSGGKRIAVTGTIEVDGTVGPIGGLVQKASAVQQAGIDTFIVPAAQGEEQIEAARAATEGVEIVPVDTYSDALDVLESLGGDALPPPPNGLEGQ